MPAVAVASCCSFAVVTSQRRSLATSAAGIHRSMAFARTRASFATVAAAVAELDDGSMDWLLLGHLRRPGNTNVGFAAVCSSFLMPCLK